MKKILVVEDEMLLLNLLNDQLKKNGYAVLNAKNGKDGLTIAKSQKPDLILMDIRMPIMDGITMLNKLRKDTYGKSAKVVILSNLEPDDKIIRQVLEDKPICYLVKSDTKLVDLVKKIKELVEE